MCQIFIYCSCGKAEKSINTRLGGLLILKKFHEKFGMKEIDGDVTELKKMFE